MSTAETGSLPVEDTTPEQGGLSDMMVRMSVAMTVDSEIIRDRLVKNAVMSEEEREARREQIRDFYGPAETAHRKYETVVRAKRAHMGLGQHLGSIATRISHSEE